VVATAILIVHVVPVGLTPTDSQSIPLFTTRQIARGSTQRRSFSIGKEAANWTAHRTSAHYHTVRL